MNADHDQLIAGYSGAIRQNPNDAESWFYRATAYAEQGDYYASLRYYNNDAVSAYNRAISDYSEAIRLEPVAIAAWFNRGNVYDSNGAYDQAISDYTEVINLDIS